MVLTVVCIASGPSLTAEDCAAARTLGPAIAVNLSFRRAPAARHCYAADDVFWDRYAGEVKSAGMECWTTSRAAADKHGLRYAWSTRCRGLAMGGVNLGPEGGANSGFQAVGLAYMFGARRIVLLGYDMQRTAGRSHWHADHEFPLARLGKLDQWAAAMTPLAVGLVRAGVEVINCSRETALTCFPRANIEDLNGSR